jgi:hypothetical protein
MLAGTDLRDLAAQVVDIELFGLSELIHGWTLGFRPDGRGSIMIQ